MASSDEPVAKKKKRTILHFFAKTDDAAASKKNNPNESADMSQSVNEDDRPSSSASVEVEAECDVTVEKSSMGVSLTQTVKSQTDRKFQRSWLSEYSWLDYNQEKNFMTCKTCIKHNKTNVFTDKNTNFRTTTLKRHANSSDHKAAVEASVLSGNLKKAVNKVLDEKEQGVMVCLKSVFWICQENIAITKYGSLLNFLQNLQCPNIDQLKTGKNVTYMSDKSAGEFVESLAHVAHKNVENSIKNSQFVSLLCDESTDIGVQKKLVVYVRVLNPDTYKPSTKFVTNIKVESATGKAIYEELKGVMENKGIENSKVMGLGTDGAKVMTGTGIGVTGYMLRDNPMILNYHCIAHRLALVTSQAANAVPYLVEYQSILTGIFYFFKASANRTSKLSEIQSLLEEPELKVKKVHEVRWLSTYNAVNTVYRILDSLITFFTSDKDAKSKGYGKKMIQYDFIASTYLLMDILPIVSEMCLVFQKVDLDVSQVKVQVDHTKRELNKHKNCETDHVTYLQQLQENHFSVVNGKIVFKGNHVVQGGQNIDSIKVKFIDSILQKIDDRFPDNDSNVIYAFAVLGMRPLSFLSKDQLELWGNDKLEVLIKQYGEEKHSVAKDEQPEVVRSPIIVADETKSEWNKLKGLVLQEGYPRDDMVTLWGLINQNYRNDYPNMLTLAALALTAPIHTADCERGFSAQNQTKTALRNRLSPETVDNILSIKLEGGDIESFDFVGALEHWRTKDRKIFQ